MRTLIGTSQEGEQFHIYYFSPDFVFDDIINLILTGQLNPNDSSNPLLARFDPRHAHNYTLALFLLRLASQRIPAAVIHAGRVSRKP